MQNEAYTLLENIKAIPEFLKLMVAGEPVINLKTGRETGRQIVGKPVEGFLPDLEKYIPGSTVGQAMVAPFAIPYQINKAIGQRSKIFREMVGESKIGEEKKKLEKTVQGLIKELKGYFDVLRGKTDKLPSPFKNNVSPLIMGLVGPQSLPSTGAGPGASVLPEQFSMSQGGAPTAPWRQGFQKPVNISAGPPPPPSQTTNMQAGQLAQGAATRLAFWKSLLNAMMAVRPDLFMISPMGTESLTRGLSSDKRKKIKS